MQIQGQWNGSVCMETCCLAKERTNSEKEKERDNNYTS